MHFIFAIFARLLLPHAHFSSKFTKLSFIWYFTAFMRIFTKKFFRRCAILGESPGDEMIFFLEKSFAPKASQVSFLNIFFKIPKGGVRRLQAASNLLLGESKF